jgi:hypothetical protein
MVVSQGELRRTAEREAGLDAEVSRRLLITRPAATKTPIARQP